MSVWERLRQKWSARNSTEEHEALQPSVETQPRPEEPPVEDSGELRTFLNMARVPGHGAEEDFAVDLFHKLCATPRAADGLDASITVIEVNPSWSQLRLVTSREFVRLGDDKRAASLLEPVLLRTNPPVEAVALLAEISERFDDSEQAIRLYQRVLAIDVDYPNAGTRLQRLQAEGSAIVDASGGVTLMSSGALLAERFRILRELGRGGAGTVFAAEDRKLNRRVALKLYHGRDAEQQARLLLEAQVAAQFEHAGVIRILDVELSLGAIVMEWVQGGSLKQMVAREGDSFDTRREALLLVCETLMHLHGRGWVHRDIKPSNILLRSNGTPVISDFGLAREEGTRLEMAGQVGEGSLGFMPPEQARSGPVHRSADVFSFGATAAKLLRGMGALVPVDLATALLQAGSAKPVDRVNLEHLHRVLSRAD